MNKIFTVIILVGVIQMNAYAQVKNKEKQFTGSLMQDSCNFSVTGRNMYFILEPGYRLILDGHEDNDSVRLVITVLNETRKIGNIETRVVEENESVNGKTREISRNYFAFCDQTGSVYYFGEEVDMYSKGKIVSHEGAWKAEGKNKAGVIMPGLILLGARYYQEMAPGIAMDRAEIISMNEKMITPAGTYFNCIKIEETTPLEPINKEYKYYAPGIGLIRDGDLLLVKSGFIN